MAFKKKGQETKPGRTVTNPHSASYNVHSLQSVSGVACSHVNGVLALYIKTVWAIRCRGSMWLTVSVRPCTSGRIHLLRVCTHAALMCGHWTYEEGENIHSTLHTSFVCRWNAYGWANWPRSHSRGLHLNVKDAALTPQGPSGQPHSCDGVAPPTPPTT